MKKHHLVMVLLLVSVLLVGAAGCSQQTGTEPSAAAESGSAAAQSAAESPAEESESGGLVLTAAELAAYDGKDGQPAYVAVDGVVYDVTDVPQWANGDHYEGMTAGQDLTEQIETLSPHGTSVLDGLPVVGTLEG